MKKLLLFAIAALLVPSAALAKSPHPDKSTHANHGKAKVLYVLKGTLSAYTPYDSSAGPGSITIEITRANRHAKALVGSSLTFADMVVANTKVVLRHHVTVIGDGDAGLVKIRAPKTIAPADLAATLGAQPVRQIIDQHAAPSS
jgi:hypothetical protein